jgi:hypothetical protein
VPEPDDERTGECVPVRRDPANKNDVRSISAVQGGRGVYPASDVCGQAIARPEIAVPVDTPGVQDEIDGSWVTVRSGKTGPLAGERKDRVGRAAERVRQLLAVPRGDPRRGRRSSDTGMEKLENPGAALSQQAGNRYEEREDHNRANGPVHASSHPRSMPACVHAISNMRVHRQIHTKDLLPSNLKASPSSKPSRELIDEN